MGCVPVCGSPSQNVLGWHRLASSTEQRSATVALRTWMERWATITAQFLFTLTKCELDQSLTYSVLLRWEPVDLTVAFSPTYTQSVWSGWTRTAWNWFATARASVCLAALVINTNFTTMTLLDVAHGCWWCCSFERILIRLLHVLQGSQGFWWVVSTSRTHYGVLMAMLTRMLHGRR